MIDLPVNHRAVILINRQSVWPRLTYLRQQLVLINRDAQARLRQQRPIPVHQRGQGLSEKIGMLVIAAFLNQEVWNRRRQLQTRRSAACGKVVPGTTFPQAK